jgi:hypothetical protein
MVLSWGRKETYLLFETYVEHKDQETFHLNLSFTWIVGQNRHAKRHTWIGLRSNVCLRGKHVTKNILLWRYLDHGHKPSQLL